jgi:hypothetical protein
MSNPIFSVSGERYQGRKREGKRRRGRGEGRKDKDPEIR